MFSLAVVGSRSFHDYQSMEYEINRIFRKKRQEQENAFMIVSGGARGADRLAKQYVDEYPYDDLFYREYKPDWEKYGKKAGILRNYDIVNDAHMVLAFWNGESKGTKHTIGYTKDKRIRLRVVRF